MKKGRIITNMTEEEVQEKINEEDQKRKEKEPDRVITSDTERVRKIRGTDPNQPTYTFQAGNSASGFSQEISKMMYERAKKLHPEWVREKWRIDHEMPKLKEIMLRMDSNYVVEKTENPTINKIDHCIEIIEEVEASHKGQFDEKMLN